MMMDSEIISNSEIISSLVIIISGVILRIISHYEHKKTSKQVGEIYSLMNGELQTKLEKVRQEGRDEKR